MRLFRNTRFKIKRWWNKFHNSPTTVIMTQTHFSAASIFRVALKNEESELIFMPVIGKRIIKMEKHGIYIKLEKFSISIINHQYNYMVEIPYSLYEKLITMFDNKMDTYYHEEEKITLL